MSQHRNRPKKRYWRNMTKCLHSNALNKQSKRICVIQFICTHYFLLWLLFLLFIRRGEFKRWHTFFRISFESSSFELQHKNALIKPTLNCSATPIWWETAIVLKGKSQIFSKFSTLFFRMSIYIIGMNRMEKLISFSN